LHLVRDLFESAL